MFDLEKAIADWRKQMLDAGITAPAPLDELEIHLREEIERQIQSGLNTQKAFEISAQHIGEPQLLKNEFNKTQKIFMSRNLKLSLGITGLLVGAAMMVPGCIQLRNELMVTNGKLGLLLLGWFLLGWSAGTFQKIFRPKLFKDEFANVKMTPMKQALKIGAGVIVILLSLAFLMPPAAQAVHEGAMKFEDLCFLVFGGALLITGALVTFCSYKKRVA